MDLSIVLLWLLSCFETVTCSGKISLKLVSYSNPNSRLSDGSCCDGVSCGNDCDNYFKLCLTRPSDSRCALGYKQTSVLGDDSFDFGGSLGGGTSNPAVYGFTKWEGSFALSVEVRDKDSGIFGKDDDVDRLDKNWVLPAHQKESLARTERAILRGKVATLTVEARVFCNERYLLPTCEEYCEHTNNDQGHYDCDYANGKKVCLDGWYGPKCLQKRKDCTPRDNVIGHYRCDPVTGDIICLSGWRDEKSNCTKEINECQSNPCLNEGVCSDLIADFNCSCKAGYSGKRCEQDINECLSSPCIYGRCNDLINNYTCDCRAGFFGRHCEHEIDECLSNPCKNGNCINAANAFKCQCRRGFTGITCEIEIDECLSSPCKNNATCSDLIEAYNCTCMPGFTGRHCDFSIQDLLERSQTIKPTNSQAKHLVSQHVRTSSITTEQIYKKSLSNIPAEKSRDSETAVTRTEAADTVIRIQATRPTTRLSVTKRYLGFSNSILQSRNGKLVSNLPMSEATGSTKVHKTSFSSCFTMNQSGKRTCSASGSENELLPPFSLMSNTVIHTASASASGGVTDKKADGSNNEIKIVTYELQFHGDVNKWSSDRSKTCDQVICESMETKCSAYKVGCGVSENPRDAEKDGPYELQIIKMLPNESLIVAHKQFEVDVTKSANENNTISCIEQAILESAESIEKKSSFKISKLTLISIVEKKTHESSQVLLRSISLVSTRKTQHSTETPTERLSLKTDRSKLLAIIVVCHILAIVLFLLLIQWRRQMRSQKRVTPMSTKRLYNNNMNETDTEIIPKKNVPKTEKKFEINLAKPRALTLDKSKQDQASLLEREADQLETFFL